MRKLNYYHLIYKNRAKKARASSDPDETTLEGNVVLMVLLVGELPHQCRSIEPQVTLHNQRTKRSHFVNPKNVSECRAL